MRSNLSNGPRVGLHVTEPQYEWLEEQPTSTAATIRRLIDDAREGHECAHCRGTRADLRDLQTALASLAAEVATIARIRR